ncbi:MAG: hypothetical protein V5A55_11490, partial [Halovenus sp.]
FGKAYQKAQMCVGKPIPLEGTMVVDLPVAGFEEFFDVKELDDFADNAEVKQAISDGEIDLVISRERDVLETCVEETVTYFSTVESAQAALEAIRHSDEPLDVAPIDDRSKLKEYWGQPKGREDLRTQIETLRGIVDAGYLDALGAEGTEIAAFGDTLETVLETVDRSVLVLSSGTGDRAVGTQAVRDALASRGYDARVATDLPGVEGRTAEQDTATYMMLSKFSVLVDRDPSRRLTTFETARAHDNVLARLVPADRDRRSTHVIGGHGDADVDHIRTFEFDENPTEVLDDAISWAESVVERRRQSTRDRLPWAPE